MTTAVERYKGANRQQGEQKVGDGGDAEGEKLE